MNGYGLYGSRTLRLFCVIKCLNGGPYFQILCFIRKILFGHLDNTPYLKNVFRELFKAVFRTQVAIFGGIVVNIVKCGSHQN